MLSSLQFAVYIDIYNNRGLGISHPQGAQGIGNVSPLPLSPISALRRQCFDLLGSENGLVAQQLGVSRLQVDSRE